VKVGRRELGKKLAMRGERVFYFELHIFARKERYQPDLSLTRRETTKSSRWEMMPDTCSPEERVTVAGTSLSSDKACGPEVRWADICPEGFDDASAVRDREAYRHLATRGVLAGM